MEPELEWDDETILEDWEDSWSDDEFDLLLEPSIIQWDDVKDIEECDCNTCESIVIDEWTDFKENKLLMDEQFYRLCPLLVLEDINCNNAKDKEQGESIVFVGRRNCIRRQTLNYQIETEFRAVVVRRGLIQMWICGRPLRQRWMLRKVRWLRFHGDVWDREGIG